MYLQLDQNNNILNTFDSLPSRIRLSDSSTRTSLHELTIQEQEALGLYQYTEIIVELDPVLEFYTGELVYDHENRTFTRSRGQKTLETVKQESISIFIRNQELLRNQGFTCSNNIVLKVQEPDLVRWTQMMMSIIAFQPETVNIWDITDTKHALSSLVVSNMLAELSTWFQSYLDTNNTVIEQIQNAATIEEVLALI